jgi:DNA-binding LytR/AlgR family response regulator
MLSVIVCDDDRFRLESSVKMVRECIKEDLISVQVVCAATDFKEVLLFIEKNPGQYLYFLDIDFGKTNLNGVDIAKVIKKSEPLSKIVFVTSHADMGMNVLKSGVEAFGFIEKTNDKIKMLSGYKKYISLALGSISTFNENLKSEKQIKLLVGIEEYITLPVSQILYVETSKTVSHFICYHTVDGSSISVRDTIEKALKNLGKDFMKSHRSVVINKSYVTSVSDGLVKFSGGETVACSFRLKNDVIKKCGVKKAW